MAISDKFPNDREEADTWVADREQHPATWRYSAKPHVYVCVDGKRVLPAEYVSEKA